MKDIVKTGGRLSVYGAVLHKQDFVAAVRGRMAVRPSHDVLFSSQDV